GLMAIALVELRASGRLRRLDPDAPKVLALNQLALAGLLIAYALWRIYEETSGGQGAFADVQAGDPQVARMLRPYEDMGRQIALGVYGLLIAVAVFVQGGMAWYYFNRRKVLRNYLDRTPPWILAMQRAGAPV